MLNVRDDAGLLTPSPRQERHSLLRGVTMRQHGDHVIDRTHEMGLKAPMLRMSALDHIVDALGAQAGTSSTRLAQGR